MRSWAQMDLVKAPCQMYLSGKKGYKISGDVNYLRTKDLLEFRDQKKEHIREYF